MYFIATTTYIGLTLVEKTPTKIELLLCKGIGLLIIIIIGLTTIRAGIEQPDSNKPINSNNTNSIWINNN